MDQERVWQYVSEHGKSLTRLCLRLCRNRTDAEDLYQETWCRVCGKLRQYDEAQPFEPWLFAICVNTFRNQVKRNKRRPVAEFATNEEQDRVLEGAPDETPVFDAERDQLRRIIDGLEDKYRIVTVLYYFRDFSVAELASILRVPQGTVKSRLFKAREIIKRRLEHEV